MSLAVARSLPALRDAVAAWRREGLSVGFVPTMGALHEGHLSLVRAALAGCDRAVVSIFVNPTQFGPNEDFSAYPRKAEADAALLEVAGANLLYLPDVATIYPPGFATTVHVAGLTDPLCGPHRPGHFDGVATVVAKLLLQVAPDRAWFGEKDFQQLQVVRRLVRDLDIPVAIEAGATVRDEAGLALSSRNAYLSPAELAVARQLNVVLRETGQAALADPAARDAIAARGADRLRALGFGPIDYLDIRDAETLEPWPGPPRPGRVLVAARLGKTRLIDNLPVQ